MKVKITSEYITLGQFLKFAHIIETGGQEKIYLLSKLIFVNNEKENRRGRKLYPNDVVKIENESYEIVK